MVLVQNVSKIYRLYNHPFDRLREFLPLQPPLHSSFWALRDINFFLERGEILGLVGPNGSGKSTLLQIVSGILQPTQGRVVTRGRIAALLELGAGFNPEFTGRENIFMSGEIIGLSRAEVQKALPSIEAFADIGDFVDRPVKEYSSGMYVRLAFSTAIHVEPDILIVDEALAVGDAVFANRCIRKFDELRERNVTVLFVSHDLGLVKQLAQRAMLLLKGELVAEGTPHEVINQYIGLVLERQRPEERTARLESTHRHGDGSSEITAVELLNRSHIRCNALASGEPVTVRVRVHINSPIRPMIGILVRTRTGADVYGTNTRLEGIDLGDRQPGETIEVNFRFECWLTPQQYTLTVASQHEDGTTHDWLDDVTPFEVLGKRIAAGVADLRATVEWHELP